LGLLLKLKIAGALYQTMLEENYKLMLKGRLTTNALGRKIVVHAPSLDKEDPTTSVPTFGISTCIKTELK